MFSNKEEAFLQLIYGFRHVQILRAFSEAYKREDEDTEYILLKALVDSMGTLGYKLKMGDIRLLVKKFKNTIDYANFDYNKWGEGNVYASFEHGVPALSNTHDMPEDALRAYIYSMNELHASQPPKMELLKEYFEGKTVLDVGFGGGYFAQVIQNLGCAIYTGVDRKDVFGLTNFADRCGVAYYQKNLEDWLGLGMQYDTIWVSEVLHSKKDPVKFFKLLEKFLNPGGTILINTLKPNTVRSAGFAVQMQLHTGQHDYDNIQKIVNYHTDTVTFKRGKAIDLDLYHTCYVFEGYMPVKPSKWKPSLDDIQLEPGWKKKEEENYNDNTLIALELIDGTLIDLNPNRPVIEFTIMEMCDVLAKRSTCDRPNSAIGCVLISVDFKRIFGFGYNGNAAGEANQCANQNAEPGLCGCVHAEINALSKSSINDSAYMFCTASPCPSCARVIINSGKISRVYFRRHYRLEEGERLLEKHGIQLTHMKSGKDDE